MDSTVVLNKVMVDIEHVEQRVGALEVKQASLETWMTALQREVSRLSDKQDWAIGLGVTTLLAIVIQVVLRAL